MTTSSVISPEMKLMSKPRPTPNNNNNSANSKPNNNGNQMTIIMQPGKDPSVTNRRSSWSNPPRLPRPEQPPSKMLNKLPPLSSSSDATVIDSALLAALRDPRERIGLLRLEQTLIDFVMKQPQDPHMNVGGPYNSIVTSPTLGLISPGAAYPNKSQTSFQRCILHRLADRFQITRENNMDGTIRLLKQTQTKIPTRLLLDVKPEEYSLVQSLEQVSLNNGNGSAQTNNKPSFANAVSGNMKPKTSRRNSNEISVVKKNANSEKGPGPKNTKMKIMKRANSGSSNGDSMHRTNSSASLKKKNSSLTDREKAYAEARARIFQQEQEESGDLASATAAPPPMQTVLPTNAVTASNAMMHESSTTTTITTTSSIASATTTSSTNAANSKATFRDRNQDEIDPDFRRGSQLSSSGGVGLDYDHSYSNPTKDYYGYYNPPPPHQQHYPRNIYAQQQHAWVPMPTGIGNSTTENGHTTTPTAAYGHHHHYQHHPYHHYPTTTAAAAAAHLQSSFAHAVVASSTPTAPTSTTTRTTTTTTTTTVANGDSVSG